MERCRPRLRMFKQATYKVSIFGLLDKQMSDYLGGMAIEHTLILDQYPMSILTGRLTDQSALIGILNSLYDFGYPLIAVECIEAH